jgi:polysaccharide export outer membrane protein
MIRKLTESFHFPALRMALPILALPVLAACSAAPGMNAGVNITQSGVEPVMKEITPQLLQEEHAARDKAIDQVVNELLAEPKPYTVGTGDVISVVLFGQTEMTTSVSVVMAPIPNSQADSLVSTGYAVDDEGQIHLPYIGAVKVAGLTERELHEALMQQYAKYLKKPELSARVYSYRSKRLYVDGEIRNPGVLPIIDIPMTLPEALSRSGGATTMGDVGSVSLSRGGKQYVINMPQMLAHGVSPSRIMLENGDMVRVPSREESKIFVLGEVTKPTTMLPRNGHITLNEALGDAGGVNASSADPRQIYVVRSANDRHPVVYHLDAASPVALALAEGFELQAKDVVYVDATALVRWNRVVSLLLPTAQLVVDSKYLNVLK